MASSSQYKLIILDDTLRRHGRSLDSGLLSELRQRYLMHLCEEIESSTGAKRALPVFISCSERSWNATTSPWDC